VNLRRVKLTRKTKETSVSIELNPDRNDPIEINTKLPFFDHLLSSMAFHSEMGIQLKAEGDITVDPHHLVEDTGLVLGDLLYELIEKHGPVVRFGQSIIPMDEALSEVSIDVCGRPTLVYLAEFPQKKIGTFDPSLIREFLTALSTRARISLHAHIRYGSNSHHMAESLFKALGKALKMAYSRADQVLSTKGTVLE